MNKYIKLLALPAAAAAVILAASFSVSASDETESQQPFAVTDTSASETDHTVTETTIAETEFVQTETGTQETAVSETQPVITDAPEAVTQKATAVTPPEPDSSVVNGWNNINGKWYYFDGERFLTGISEIDGEYYLFAYSGSLKTGWQTIKNKRCYFDSETHSPVYGWINFNGNRYFCDKSRGKVTGMQKIGDNIYIFSSQGIMQTGKIKFNGWFYYCSEDGAVVLGDNKKTPVEIDGENYIINPKGHILLGWQWVNGKRYYFDPETGEKLSGWITDHLGGFYYIDKEYGKYTGDMTIDDHWFRFEQTGKLCTGMQSFDLNGGKYTYYYFYADGSYAVDKFLKEDGKTYYFGKDSARAEGWQTIKEKKYYFGDDGVMCTGFQNIGGYKYYFDKNGVLKTGFTDIDGKKYLFASDGKMLFGFQKLNSKTYYLDKTSGTALKGWQKIDGYKYYFDDDYVMHTGFFRINDNTYYFDKNGHMLTGWQTIDAQKYYFGDDGKMRVYRCKINGKNYLFHWNGVLADGGNNTIIELALSQLGNDGGEKFWRWWGLSTRIEWCACFVSWCAYQCGYTTNDNTPLFISCKIGIEWFKDHGLWRSKDSYIPKSGDYVFFDWDFDGIADHIGLVDVVDGPILRTVEGNSSDEVRKREYDIDSGYIYGYAKTRFPDEQ